VNQTSGVHQAFSPEMAWLREAKHHRTVGLMLLARWHGDALPAANRQGCSYTKLSGKH
jgi:hypothetical protein